MAEDGAVTLYNNTAITDAKKNSVSIKVGLPQMLRGGAVLEVSTVSQAKIAEEAGACCLVLTEPNRRGISRMPDPSLIKQVKRAVSIPIMARSRIGHFVEAQILERVGVDYIDESEVLAIADEDNFINKHNLRCPFVCGCKNLGEALRRVREGAAIIRTQGDLLGTGNIVETVKNVRSVMGEIRILNNMDEDEVFAFSKKIAAPYDLVAQTKQMGRLPVVHFAAGGIVTPADAALMMQLGCDGVFVGTSLISCVRIVTCLLTMMVTTFIWAIIMLLLLPWPCQRIRQGNIYGHVTGRLLMWILGNPIKIEGTEFSNERAIYISNHASPIDIFLIMWLTPTGTVGIAKKEIIWYPLFGQLYILANHLRIDRSNPSTAIESMNKAVQAVVEHGLSLIIFPEGTRSKNGRLLPFKKGFVHLALQSRLPIVPIVLTGTHLAWRKGSLRVRPAPISVKYLPPIKTDSWTDDKIDDYLKLVHDSYVQSLPEPQKPIASECTNNSSRS